MKLIKIIFCVLLFFSKDLQAYEFAKDWGTENTIFEASFIALYWVDLAQTYNFLYVEKNGTESNIFVGEHPSKKKLLSLGALWTVSHVFISCLLNNPNRHDNNAFLNRYNWQIIWVGIESYAVYHNYSVGVRIKI